MDVKVLTVRQLLKNKYAGKPKSFYYGYLAALSSEGELTNEELKELLDFSKSIAVEPKLKVKLTEKIFKSKKEESESKEE